MPYMIAAVYVAGIAVFATLLWNSRARVAGLAGFGLALLPSAFYAFRASTEVLGSEWMLAFQFAGLLNVVSFALLLGAVYALRDRPAPSPLESRLVRLAAIVVLIVMAFGAITRQHFFSAAGGANNIAYVVIGLLAIVGMLARWGATPPGLAVAVGFGFMAAAALLRLAGSFMDRESIVPKDVFTAFNVLGPAAVVIGFALAAGRPEVERAPYPGTEKLGMNFSRWVGLVLVFVGCALFVFLAHLITEERILQGLKGRAAVVGALLPALGLLLALIGVSRLTTGRRVWAF
ncbi:MAG TPA: hypothetical protein PKD86_10305 [Gemmatales bacterium]|nr:hypothetical protein [Gemmatales bacterium]HMP59736.1 hypothetical protein [Gemmatales bacterium]